MQQQYTNFYIQGEWVPPQELNRLSVINPATEAASATISLGGAADVDRAVAAAKHAFVSFSKTSVVERVGLFEAIIAEYKTRLPDIAVAIATELGAPINLATQAHAQSGLSHFESLLEILKRYPFEQENDGYLLRREPIGVCGLITPWNWPINQIANKVAPALAAGCTMVLKPTEIAPINAMVFAEVLHAAGVPEGVFNLVNGDGPGVGAALTSHPDVAMVSFTGSTRAGIEVAKAAADSVKRVTQELGGKSANIILDDADIEAAVASGVEQVMSNSGQTCVAPTRMLVPEVHYQRALTVAKQTAEAVVTGDPFAENTTMGPVVSEIQFNKIQNLIQKGIDEGASLLCGGTGKPAGCEAGYFVKPTVFADVTHEMTIAREEIFGPVLCIMPYTSEAEAVRIANDSVYGLAGYVQSGSDERGLTVAKQIEAGLVIVNNAPGSMGAPFGGYKQSGNGRESGEFGLEEYLEVKAVFAPGQTVANDCSGAW